MKKIAIVSCYFQHNYGSMLQAYATQEILNIMGLPNETICIDGFKNEIRKAKMAYFKSRMFSKDVIKDKIGFVKELGKHSIDYSVFIVGSDQLWLPSNIAADYYTLNFVDKRVRKVSYATSFGVSMLPEAQQKAAREFLLRIDYISVREKSGQKLVNQLTGRVAELVCDPTLLLDKWQWTKLVSNELIIKEPYIFCYFLGNNSLSRSCSKKLSKITGLRIVALQQLDMYIKKDKEFADIAPYDIDPSRFINLIRNAKFVCTDSFHGTVFSIINHKRFFSFRRFIDKTTMSTNSRIDSLLGVLGIENRIINSEDDFRTQLRVKIDYDDVDAKLDDFREQSLEYLRNSLKGLG